METIGVFLIAGIAAVYVVIRMMASVKGRNRCAGCGLCDSRCDGRMSTHREGNSLVNGRIVNDDELSKCKIYVRLRNQEDEKPV